MTADSSSSAERGAQKRENTGQDFRDAWQRLQEGQPRRADLKDKWPLTISDVCAEAGHRRNALYQNHRYLLEEIRTELARLRPKDPAAQARRRTRLESELEQLRVDYRRLVSQNAALLHRAQTAEEAVAAKGTHLLNPPTHIA